MKCGMGGWDRWREKSWRFMGILREVVGLRYEGRRRGREEG